MGNAEKMKAALMPPSTMEDRADRARKNDEKQRAAAAPNIVDVLTAHAKYCARLADARRANAKYHRRQRAAAIAKMLPRKIHPGCVRNARIILDWGNAPSARTAYVIIRDAIMSADRPQDARLQDQYDALCAMIADVDQMDQYQDIVDGTDALIDGSARLLDAADQLGVW